VSGSAERWSGLSITLGAQVITIAITIQHRALWSTEHHSNQ